MSDSESKKVNVPSISEAEIIKAAEDAAVQAKSLFLRGLPAEAVQFAQHAKLLIEELDTAAAAKLSSMVSTFSSFVSRLSPPPAPASAPAQPLDQTKV